MIETEKWHIRQPRTMNYSVIFPLLALINHLLYVKEFRQPIQVQSHLEMPGILVQLGHIQRT